LQVLLVVNLQSALSKREQTTKYPMTTAAEIDRVVNHNVILEPNLPSFRLEHSKKKDLVCGLFRGSGFEFKKGAVLVTPTPSPCSPPASALESLPSVALSLRAGGGHCSMEILNQIKSD